MSHPNSAVPPVAAPVPLLDLHRQYAPLQAQFAAALQNVCTSGRFILGPDVEACEKNIAQYCGAPHAIACASGSDALLLALLALDIRRGDEVIVPSFTFFATAGSVWQAGATPVFADVDPVSFCLDPEAVKAKITPRTKAIMPVHLYGQCVDMDAFWKIAHDHKLHLVEDAAQSIGADYHGQRCGTLGDVGCFSFYPTKNLGCFGDGGMLTTKSDDLAEKLRLLRGHGMKPRYYHRVVGINSRLDSLQAAVVNVKLPHLDSWTDQRGAVAAYYTKTLSAVGLDGEVTLPTVLPHRRHVWNQYVVRIAGGRRDALREHLTKHKIASEVYYPLGIHQQECFQRLLAPATDLPETERASLEVLALPIFPELTRGEQDRVVEAIAGFYGKTVPAAATLKGPNFLRQPQGQRADSF